MILGTKFNFKFNNTSILFSLPITIFFFFTLLPMLGIVLYTVTATDFLIEIANSTVVMAIRLSLTTSFISLLVMILVGTPVAYALARFSFYGRDLLNFLVDLPLVLPPVVAGLGMLLVFGREGYVGSWLNNFGITLSFTTWAVILAQIFVASPFYVRSAKLGFQSVQVDYEDISRTLGASPWNTFWRISVPLALPSLIGGLVLAWARAISEFGATLMFAGNFPGKTQTMPLAILTAMERGLVPAFNIALVLLGISVIVLLLLLTVTKWGRRFTQ